MAESFSCRQFCYCRHVTDCRHKNIWHNSVDRIVGCRQWQNTCRQLCHCRQFKNCRQENNVCRHILKLSVNKNYSDLEKRNRQNFITSTICFSVDNFNICRQFYNNVDNINNVDISCKLSTSIKDVDVCECSWFWKRKSAVVHASYNLYILSTMQTSCRQFGKYVDIFFLLSIAVINCGHSYGTSNNTRKARQIAAD